MRRGLGLFIRGTAGAALAAATLTSLALQAPGAGASGGVSNPYSPAYNAPYRHGAFPTASRHQKMRSYAATHQASTLSTGPETLAYGGGIDGIGVTSGTPRVYLVFWGTQWGTAGTDSNGNTTFSNDPSHGAPYLQQLFKGLGTNNELWSGVMTQYCDGSLVANGATSCPTAAPRVGYPTGGDLAGVWYDNSAAEPTTASGHQIGVEAVNAAGHFGNTTAASNRYAQYVVLSATGLNPDSYKNQGFCAWHDYNGDSTLSGGAVSSPYGDIAFTNMPYVMDLGASCGQGFVNSPGTLDGYSIVEGHEYAETVTDQNPAGGWTNHQNNSFGGEETGDECAWISSGQGASADVTTATGTFAMQSVWSNDTNRCDISHAIVTSAPANDFSISDNPTSSGTVTSGNSATTTVSTAVTSGSAQTVNLSASGLPAGTTAIFNPASVTAGAGSTLTLTTSASTPTGSYNVTITGTGTSATHSTTFNLSVSGNDFSISDSPTSAGVTAGQSAATVVSTALTSGSAQSVSLSASGVPAGTTATFTPSSVTVGDSGSTLTLATSTATPGGTYTVTITGTGVSATHSTTFVLSVTGVGGQNAIVNGGFESGFTGWTRSGTTSLASPGHSGTYAAMAGAKTPTNGNSSVSQTFTAATGDSTVRFYYDVVCPDTVTYDWATATLRDNTLGRTTTVLARTCVSNSGWKLVSAAVTPGHSYTLTLTSRDDNYPGDPTYTLFDDVSTS